MFFRFGAKSGAAVPPAGEAVQDIHTQLQQQQQAWADKLAKDPACFAALEQRDPSPLRTTRRPARCQPPRWGCQPARPG